MAESAVNFLIEYLGPLLVDEVKLLKGVRGEVSKIRDELESMRAFLKDADAKEHSNEGIKTWVRQVRHAACDTEDILDEFILRIGQYHPQDGLGILRFVHKITLSVKQLKARHQIARQIQDIRIRLSEISKRKDDFNLLNNAEMGSSVNNRDIAYDTRLVALFMEESQLVGIEGPRAWIIDWLLSKDQKRLSTMSVVGMGGLGKTTLIKKVYDSQQVKEHFETYAWITVSETFKKIELLQDMIKQFFKVKQEQVPSELGTMTDMQLIQVLRDYLQNKRFILIADDLWEENAWKVLSLALPIHENGSRVVLTMRRHDVASSCCIGPSDHIYQLQPLDSDSAWSLFCRRAFPKADHEKIFVLSSELETLARSFVNKCQGLPLAIVTLGGLLATKDETYAAWDMMYRSLGSELNIHNQLKSMMEILWLSFNDLPYYLKSCFSYLTIFPEDYSIGRGQIIKLWIAEGFIERKEGRTPEEVGESYLYNLLSRSLIQVSSAQIDGKIISFRIHDLLREIIIFKSGEENLIVSSYNVEEKISLSDEVRRLSIYHNKGEMIPKCESSSSSHLRSFFIFGEYGQSITSSAIKSFAGLHLLRVLSIANIYMDNFPKDLTRLLHLRYLNLYDLEVKNLPSSIMKLRNLETLIIEDTLIHELPVEIYKLQRLRYLYVSRELKDGTAFHIISGAKVGNGIGYLRSLHELRKIEIESGAVGELGKLTQLRILEIIKLKREDGHNLCNSIENMRHLKYLEVNSIEEGEEIDLHSLTDPPLTIQELVLNGHLKKFPHWISALKDLRTLTLGWSGLKDDPLKALSSLPNLVVLYIMYNAYDGEELHLKKGGHLKLKELSLENLKGLKKVTVEKGAMPNLEVLLIENCEVLVDVPSWLGHLTKLKKLALRDMPMSFLESLQIDSGAQRADFIKHISLVNHYDSESSTTQKF